MTKTLRVLFVALFSLLFGQQISAQIFYESFDKCAGTGGNDGKFSNITNNKDLSDEFTDNAGWTGVKASAASKCVSVGQSKTEGSVTTPALSKLSGNAVLTFRAAAWDKDATDLTLSIEGGTLSETTVTLTKGAFQEYTVNITGGTSATKITFAGTKSKNRFFLDDVKIVSGSADVKKDAGLQFSEPSIQIEKGQTFTAPTFTKATSAAVTFSSDNEKVATVDAEGVISLAGGEGTAVITAKAEEDDEYYAGEAKCTITVFTYNVYKKVAAVTSGNKYLLVAQRDGNTYYAYPLKEDKAYGYLSTGKIEGSTDEVKVKSFYDDAFTFTANGDGYDINDHLGRYYMQQEEYTSFNTQTDVPETQWTVTPNGDGTFRIEMNGYYIQFGQGTYTSFGVWQDAQKNAVQPMLYELVSEPTSLADIKINEGEGFATAYRDAAFTVPEGLTAGIVTKVNDNKSLTVDYRYNAGDVVPAKTPVLVKGNAGTYKLEAAESTELAPAGNLLHGADAVKDGKTFVDGTDVKYYILSKGTVDGKEVIGFFWAAENGAAVDYVDGKAFLAIDAANGAKLSEGFSLEGDATGIESVETKAQKHAGAVYTIAGVRLNKKVNELTKGLYIVNGKKVIVK